jgi:hypothetical protein
MVDFIKEFLDGKYGHLSKNANKDEAKEDKEMQDMISKLGIKMRKSYTGLMIIYIKKGIAHWIRDKDEIVEPSAHTLHFQGDSKQKTMVGGIASMSVTAYLLFMVYTNGSKLIGKDDNQITSLMEQMNYE